MHCVVFRGLNTISSKRKGFKIFGKGKGNHQAWCAKVRLHFFHAMPYFASGKTRRLPALRWRDWRCSFSASSKASSVEFWSRIWSSPNRFVLHSIKYRTVSSPPLPAFCSTIKTELVLGNTKLWIRCKRPGNSWKKRFSQWAFKHPSAGKQLTKCEGHRGWPATGRDGAPVHFESFRKHGSVFSKHPRQTSAEIQK